MKILRGCLCGAIRYEVDVPLTDVGNCHCSMCRRFHGAAFAPLIKCLLVPRLRGTTLPTVFHSTTHGHPGKHNDYWRLK